MLASSARTNSFSAMSRRCSLALSCGSGVADSAADGGGGTAVLAEGADGTQSCTAASTIGGLACLECDCD